MYRDTAEDLERHRDQARMIAERTPVGGRVLEIASGPGHKSGDYEITGLDLGDAAAIPFEDATFDSVLCCVAFKNFAQPVSTLREMRRVLKPGGRVMIVDPRKDVTKRFLLGTALPRRAYTKAKFADLLDQAEVRSYDIAETPISLVIDIYK